VTFLSVQHYLAGLRETMKPVSVHHHFRALKTFFRWCIEADLLSENPVRGITIKSRKPCPGSLRTMMWDVSYNPVPRRSWDGGIGR